MPTPEIECDSNGLGIRFRFLPEHVVGNETDATGQEIGETTQEIGTTTQETTQEMGVTTQETGQKTTRNQILTLLRQHPSMTQKQLAKQIGLSLQISYEQGV